MFRANLGHGLLMISNYGYTLPRFDRTGAEGRS